eukprot:CAMPEP_0196823864 /NCGR_PEP_ID=MMETSP1362-20130617/89391_1 /TAXON_ID=163516 /ORGANISM="Leptocylindrus danicus, Strain CCMP1856" /LENGTH=166 /DNA_ID=CAMNT_0042203905 /DNA_START=130 /DNA_END=630 /DNA_ORIENTATION=-
MSSSSNKDPLWYKEKSRYKDTACRPDGSCGAVCVGKRIVRGYKATRAFQAENDRVLQMAKTEAKNPNNSEDMKHVYGSYERNEERKKKNAARDKKWAVGGTVGGTVLTDAIIPVAGGAALSPVSFGIAAGVGAAAAAIPYGVKSMSSAYERGKRIDEAKLHDHRRR